jgi:hypothetical protein
MARRGHSHHMISRLSGDCHCSRWGQRESHSGLRCYHSKLGQCNNSVRYPRSSKPSGRRNRGSKMIRRGR